MICLRALVCLFLFSSVCSAQEPFQDRRLAKPIDYNGYFPWTPPKTLAEWEARRKILREQVLVANGLWPMPEKTPLQPVIHGKVQRDGYTVENVFFASYPGHYVSGNLYRPTGRTGKLPAVLCPHGHWADGRLQTATDKQVEAELKSGAEGTANSARFHFQAMHAQLARMGCVVFQYDMVGVADSKKIAHREGFKDVAADLWLQNFMGLQTWNSIRSLDFILSLPEVDPARIGVTGGSGGGTQSFLLSGIDERIAASFPAVMVSTSMQGGCICENCPYLRVDTGNIELAALTAPPRPLGMTAANDWTKEIETKGLPELKALYALYGAEDKVMAKAFLQFGHNYNQVSREVMYNFFNKHLKLGIEGTIREQPFEPVPIKELSVYNEKNPLPSDAADADELKRTLTALEEKQLKDLEPKDAAGLERSRKVMNAALRSMIGDSLAEVNGNRLGFAVKIESDGVDGHLIRKDQKISVPLRCPRLEKLNGRLVVFVGGNDAKDFSPQKTFDPLMKSGIGLHLIEPFRTKENTNIKAPTTNMKVGNLTYSGYFYGYNRALVAERVRDILTAVAWARQDNNYKHIDLVGVGEAGPWVLLARGLCDDAVDRTIVDMNGFRFEQVNDFDHPMMLPGALKYGGLPGLTSVIAPHELYLHNTKGAGSLRFLQAAYQASGQPTRLHLEEDRADTAKIVEWLQRK